MSVLPALHAPESGGPRRREGSGPRGSLVTVERPRPRVLIVDDDEDTRELYEWCLRAAGWIVEGVADGEGALLVAHIFKPDVIVMDLRLPALSGLEASRLLKVSETTREIRIVACSGVDRSHAEALAREAGCETFVAKPCPPEDLRAVLEGLVLGSST